MAAKDKTTGVTKTDREHRDEVAAYDNAEQARAAVKLLTNQGYTAEQIFVLCTDKKRYEEFRSRLMPAGAPQLNTAPSVVGGAGAAIGATILGGAGLAAGPVAAVAGATVGAVTGAGVGVLLGAGTYSDDETNRLLEQHRASLDAGKIVVVVRPRSASSRGKTETGDAEEILQAAHAPQG